MTQERRRTSRPSRPTPRMTPDAAAAPPAPAPRTSTPRRSDRRTAPTPGRIESRRLDGQRLLLVRAGKALGETAATSWFQLMVWLVTVRGALSAAGCALARRGRAYFEQTARARRGVPIHVFLTRRHERLALARDLRAALRGLARTNGPLSPGLRLSVIAHHSLDGAVAGRCVRLQPDADGASTVLIELALYRDGQRLTPTEVVSRLVSCYVALTAAPPPDPDDGQGAAPSPATTSNEPAAAPPAPADASQPLASTPTAPAGPPPGAPPAATNDPAGILHLVARRAGRDGAAPRAPSSTRDPRGRWSK